MRERIYSDGMMNKRTRVFNFQFFSLCYSITPFWNFKGPQNRHGIFWGLILGSGIFLGFAGSPRDFFVSWLLAPFDHPRHLKSRVPLPPPLGTQQCRCSPMLIFRAWAACASPVRNSEADRARDESITSERSVRSVAGIANRVNGHGTATSLLWISEGIETGGNFPVELFASSDGHSGNHCSALSFF